MASLDVPMHEILPATSATAPTNTRIGACATGSLHLGSIAALKEPQNLQDQGILCVLGLVEWDIYPLTNDPRFDILVVSIEDMEDKGEELKAKLPELCDWIKERIIQNRNVLVHCHAGISRSASVVIAYLIREQEMSYDEATRFVWERRKCISPNDGFVSILKQWEIGCRGQGADLFQENSNFDFYI
ncbi:dual specificity phosphatase [Mycena floridula]|nr:dual specificity phosphatase [Mycena floridula]